MIAILGGAMLWRFGQSKAMEMPYAVAWGPSTFNSIGSGGFPLSKCSAIKKGKKSIRKCQCALCNEKGCRQ